MKIIAVLTLLFLAAGIPYVASSVIPDTANDNPEFYFTRLRYRENGMRARGTAAAVLIAPLRENPVTGGQAAAS